MLALAAAATYGGYAAYGNIHQDEGWLLESSLRVARGEVPHRDFVSIYPAGRFYLFAAVLELFEGELLAVRATWCILRGAVVGLVFALGRRMMPAPFAAAAAVLAWLLPGPWHKTFFALVPLATLAALAAWAGDRRRGWLWLAGALAGVGAWFRHDVGVISFGAAGALVMASWWCERGQPRRATAWALDTLAVTVSGAGLVAVGFVAIAAAAGAGEVAEQLVARAWRESAPPITAGGRTIALLPWSALALAVALLVQVARRVGGGRWDVPTALTGAVALVAVVTVNQSFRYPEAIRFLQGGPVFYLLWCVAAAGAWRRFGDAPMLRTAVVVIAAGIPAIGAAAVLAGAPVGLPIEYTGTIAVGWERTQPYVTSTGSTIYVSPEWARSVDFVQRTTAVHLQPGAPLAVIGRPSAAYFLLHRRNPSRLIRFADAAATAAEREAALATLVRECPVVIADGLLLRRRGAWWRRALQRHYAPIERLGPLVAMGRR